MTSNPLGRGFYERSPRIVARQLLGRLLVSRIGGELATGIIVETESYLATGDSACHAARGRTPKTEVMFGSAGLSYVYPIHAKVCFNVVTQSAERPSAVLIRAIEPVEGLATMRRRRRVESANDFARGPARLCQALAIDRTHNGLDLTLGDRLWIESKPAQVIRSKEIRVTQRIGVTSAKDALLRFVVAGNPFVSGPRRLR